MENTRPTRCYNRLWETERLLEVWKKGFVVKIFKEGDWGLLKTFDSVHRESLWNIIGSYGIPHKMVSDSRHLRRV